VQCSAVQCSAVQCSAVQCSAVQCSAVQCSAVQCSAVQCTVAQVTSDGMAWQYYSTVLCAKYAAGGCRICMLVTEAALWPANAQESGQRAV
jgi:hypothetical protein